jgi:hypothetical protein
MRTILLLFLFSSSSFVILKATKAANSEAIDPSRNPGDNTGGGNKKLGNTKRPEWVPGCPDLESLEASSITQLTTKELQQLSCFCGPPGQEDNEVTNGAPVKPMPTAEDEVSIACIFGSTVADLERAMELVWKANKSVERVSSFTLKNYSEST